LLSWVESEFEISMKYTTLYEYTRRNFKTKIITVQDVLEKQCNMFGRIAESATSKST